MIDCHRHLFLQEMRDEATHDRVELVSGRNETEAWKEANASALSPMFKTFRKEFAAQLTTRFALSTTPSKHVLLALKMNPSINTTATSPLLVNKAAMAELMKAEYQRALRRQCVLHQTKAQLVATQAHPQPEAGAAAETGAEAGAGAAAATETAVPVPAPKRRKSLLGSVAAQQSTEDTPNEGATKIDSEVQAEIERFAIVSAQIIAAGPKGHYYEGKSRLNLRKFWADHKTSLPLHFAVYLAMVGCKKAAAANVESVFSGAGKFTEEAKSAGHVLLSRIIRLHYNYNYPFLRPTLKQVKERYDAKFRPTVLQRARAAAAAAAGPSP